MAFATDKGLLPLCVLLPSILSITKTVILFLKINLYLTNPNSQNDREKSSPEKDLGL